MKIVVSYFINVLEFYLGILNWKWYNILIFKCQKVLCSVLETVKAAKHKYYISKYIYNDYITPKLTIITLAVTLVLVEILKPLSKTDIFLTNRSVEWDYFFAM